MKKINILETTLRDGSYAVNFSFTSADTAIICKELEDSGFDFIEIGHGIGLNASNAGHGESAQTDEEYMAAASGVLKRARYGMFCIPGIARLQNIDLAGKYGMGFIRIGTNVTEVTESKKYIKRAKKYGMFVAANYMKSYAVPPEEFAEKVRLSEEYGADMIYIVDSAGGMFPENIRQYYEAVREVSDLPVGFHGHDNLGHAVSNSLEAVKMGIEYIDSSLQGLGRSTGNAATEIVIVALLKMGYAIHHDYLKILEVGRKYIMPLLTAKGRMPLDIVAGFADFHSSYMHHIHKYSSKYSVDPARLIIEICKIDKVHIDEKMLDKIARDMKANEDVYLGKYEFSHYIGREQDDDYNK